MFQQRDSPHEAEPDLISQPIQLKNHACLLVFEYSSLSLEELVLVSGWHLECLVRLIMRLEEVPVR